MSLSFVLLVHLTRTSAVRVQVTPYYYHGADGIANNGEAENVAVVM